MELPLQRSAARSLLLLITDGFDGCFVTRSVAKCRENGVAVVLVAASKQPVRSNHGIQFQPDVALHETNLIPGQPVLLVVDSDCLPTTCATDPRIGRFLHYIAQHDGTIYVTPEAALVLNKATVWDRRDRDRFVIWWGHDIAQLTNHS